MPQTFYRVFQVCLSLLCLGRSCFVVRLNQDSNGLNQRGEDSENRIKELKNDFGARQMPCGDFNAKTIPPI
jgi:hypothetical protein